MTTRPRDLWTLCKVRKAHRCWRCDKEQPKGSQLYRPMGNGQHRMKRICQACAGRIAGE